MSEADFYRWWYLGAVAGGAAVIVVVSLLGIILLIMRSAARLAGAALEITAEIESSTRPLGSLTEANTVTEEILRSVRSIESRAMTIADALEAGEQTRA